MHLNCTTPLVDPFASLSASLTGVDTGSFPFEYEVPLLDSPFLAAEMVELYCQALARDVPFCQYDTSPIIQQCLSFMNNDPNVRGVVENPPEGGFPLTPQTIFRNTYPNCSIGPYVSQLFLFNVPLGAIVVQQQQHVYPSKDVALQNGVNIEWCLNQQQTVLVRNGH